MQINFLVYALLYCIGLPKEGEIGNARIPLPKAGKEQAMEYLQNLETLKTGMTERFLGCLSSVLVVV